MVGSDQVAELDGAVLTKPGSHDRAVAQLRGCSGRTVNFHTGLAVVPVGIAGATRSIERSEYRVRFRALSGDEIERYLLSEAPYACASSSRRGAPSRATTC